MFTFTIGSLDGFVATEPGSGGIHIPFTVPGGYTSLYAVSHHRYMR